jgi:methylenetetrahydrofolate reductase (NADPH)
VLLKEKLESGRFVVLAEMEPPKGVDISEMLKNATRIKGKVDALVVPEMSNAVMRMSALGGSLLLQNIGMETVMQVCCRDRNRLALQGDLLAAHAGGIHTIMAVAGEDTGYGDHHQAKAVHDITVTELLETIHTLRSGHDMAGIELQGAPDFTVGATVNAGLAGDHLKAELAEMALKQEKGASFFVTPPIFDIVSITPFLDQVNFSTTRIIPTVLLLKSLGMARYMARNVAHVHIPDALVQRLQKAPDKVRECILIAAETIRAVKEKGFPGVVISTIGWEDKIPDILERL